MIFGFAHTNFSLIYTTIKNNLDPSSVQFITKKDSVVRKRCYIVLGLKTLSKDKIADLNDKTGTLVIIDALPVLRRIQNIEILDANNDINFWKRKEPNFKLLLKAIREKPKPISLVVEKDCILQNMIELVKNRSLLDKILIAAKLMEPADRTSLHKEVALLLAKKMSMVTFKKRVESRGVSGKKYEQMLDALRSDVAKRLSLALHDYTEGCDPQLLASKYNVEASEIRFIVSHLKGK